ncbi:uncharacterized protein JCM15063_003933 [Sporobolomyces koalae]|uniref:uncharacterized protein n=1 Tax=Sporobolomyces koalae TaxID=500713 RepID=UPI00317637E1
MLTRLPKPVCVSLPASNAAPTLPGLVSTLRPVKRLWVQLDDELNLLHRFSYKNKNQHKGAHWWKKVIHVDRTLHRTLDEVESLLAHFGWSKDSDDVPQVGREQLVTGLVHLPRSMLLLEKSVQVLLDCASILEQLIETKAFLAFALIIVSLVARLHSLVLVMHAELGKLTSVLLSLIETNQLTGALEPLLARLPKDLRKFVTNPAPIEFLVPDPPMAKPDIISQTTSGDNTHGRNDDLGAVITRKPLKVKTDEQDARRKRALPLDSPDSVPPVPSVQRVEPAQTEVEAIAPRKKKKKVAASDQVQLAGLNTIPASSPFDPVEPITVDLTAQKDQRSVRAPKQGVVDEKQKKQRKASSVLNDPTEPIVKKKKKKVRKSMDEIDAIFG